MLHWSDLLVARACMHRTEANSGYLEISDRVGSLLEGEMEVRFMRASRRYGSTWISIAYRRLQIFLEAFRSTFSHTHPMTGACPFTTTRLLNGL